MSEHERKQFFSAGLSMFERVSKRNYSNLPTIEQVYSQMSEFDQQHA